MLSTSDLTIIVIRKALRGILAALIFAAIILSPWFIDVVWAVLWGVE